MNPRTYPVIALFVAALACGGGPSSGPSTTPPPPAGERVLLLTDEQGVALAGHDAVAYVVDSTAVEGSSEHATRHLGAVYWFSSAENLTAFEADPARYLPRYGGYCAYAASQNRLSPVEPDVFQILDGQLVLFTNEEFQELFNQDPPGHKAKADQNWPGLVAKHGKPAAP